MSEDEGIVGEGGCEVSVEVEEGLGEGGHHDVEEGPKRKFGCLS